ncbi:hypothetical protein CON64_20155 [Bacillus pseudomycoides]|nr:hypothetical protein CON64_20155 [Bacillus pseudomycoides]
MPLCRIKHDQLLLSISKEKDFILTFPFALIYILDFDFLTSAWPVAPAHLKKEGLSRIFNLYLYIYVIKEPSSNLEGSETMN